MLKTKRKARGDIESVDDEAVLHLEAFALIEEAIRKPNSFKLSPGSSAQLQRDPRFKDSVAFAIIVLSSHLFPLSWFIYRNNVENITVYAYNHYMVQFTEGVRVEYESGLFKNEQHMADFFRKIIKMRGATGQLELTDASPIAEVNIGAIARIQLVQKPAISGNSGMVASIRVPSRSKVRDLENYVITGGMTRGEAQFLEACVKGRANILISGGTGSGKTTFMRVLLGMVPESENIVVVEDGAELHLEQDRGDGKPWHENTISLSSVASVRAESDFNTVTMHDLVRHALRFQPDRIILGESRGEEMAAICKALLTGHDGSMSTIHAESTEFAIEQAIQYAMENPRFQGNESLATKIVFRAFHLVVHLKNLPGGKRQIAGIAAILAGGNQKMIYEVNEHGEVERKSNYLRDLERLTERVSPFLPSDSVPPA